MTSKYIVRQPIKDADNRIIGYEIQYYGENQAFGGEGADGPMSLPRQTLFIIS